MSQDTLSPQTPAAAAPHPLVPLWVAGLYREASGSVRAGLLECLLRPVGMLGLVAVAGGVFAALRQRHGWQALEVTVEDTRQVTEDHVYQLALYLQEAAPQGLARLADLLSQQPAALATVSGALLLEALRQRRRLGDAA
jgi:hypothetical protein